MELDKIMISQRELSNRANKTMANTITTTTEEEPGRQKTTQRRPNSANKLKPHSIKSKLTRTKLKRSS
jgi:hypothetical protein